MADSKKYDGSQWKHSLRKFTTATEAVENPLYSDGTAITSYTIKGNTVQNGTPTSDNPVDVNGVGERTENLFDNETASGYYNDSGVLVPDSTASHSTTYIPVSKTTYTASGLWYDTIQMANFAVYEWDSNKNWLRRSNRQFPPSSNKITFTIGTDTAYITLQVQSIHGNIMLNTDSKALPYEPYGYKIPISNGQQTIDIYIGDLPLLKSLDGTAVDEISNGTLTRRVDSDGSVLPTPTTTQITMPSIPTTEGANSISVDTTVQPLEFTATWTGWHDASVKEWDGSQWNE